MNVKNIKGLRLYYIFELPSWFTTISRLLSDDVKLQAALRRSIKVVLVPPAPHHSQGWCGGPHAAVQCSRRASASRFRNLKLWEVKSVIIGYKQTHLWPQNEILPLTSRTVKIPALFFETKRYFCPSSSLTHWEKRLKGRQAVSSLTSLEEGQQVHGPFLPRWQRKTINEEDISQSLSGAASECNTPVTTAVVGQSFCWGGQGPGQHCPCRSHQPLCE